MALHPKNPTDLSLAPVAASIDLNLQSLRDLTPDQIDYEVALTLNLDTSGAGVGERRAWVLEAATRNVNLHNWHADITEDSDRLHLEGGSVSIELALSASILDYIEHGGRASAAV
jgi:hypothetical protein